MSNNTTILDGYTDDKLLVVLVYSSVTTIMFIPYCISLYIIKRYRSIFDPAFRNFALNMGFADLQLMANVGYVPAVAYFLPFPIPYGVAKILGAIGAFAWFSYAMLAQMMSINRFICVFWPMKARIIYSRWVTMAVVVFCWIHGLVWSSFYLKPNVAIYFSFEQMGVRYDFQLNGTEAVFWANTVFDYIHVSSLCLIYGSIYIKIRQERKRILDPNLANDRKKENKVLIQASIICSMDVAVVATWVIFQKLSTSNYTLLTANIVALTGSGSTGYLYILMNNTVRQKLMDMVSVLFCRETVERTNLVAPMDYRGIRRVSIENDPDSIHFEENDVML